MSARGIPFTQEDRATIRSTATWMLVAGVCMTAVGAYSAYGLRELLPLLGMLPLAMVALPLLAACGQLVLGVFLLIGSRAFARVADDGGLAALGRGLAALTVIYMIQAVAMVLAIVAFARMFMLPMLGA